MLPVRDGARVLPVSEGSCTPVCAASRVALRGPVLSRGGAADRRVLPGAAQRGAWVCVGRAAFAPTHWDAATDSRGRWGAGAMAAVAPCPLDFGEGVHRGALLLLKELDVPHE